LAIADHRQPTAHGRDQWRAQNGRASGEQGGRELPSRAAMAEILEALCGALFPMRLGPVDLREESEDFYVGHTLDVALNALLAQARLELRYAARHSAQVDTEVEARPPDHPGLRPRIAGVAQPAGHRRSGRLSR
jgi:hypothetical protein